MCGFFSTDELESFMQPLSALNGHPNRNKVPGVETNTGPLGHGLPVAVGTAMAAKSAGHDSRVFVVIGDGELQEGSNWEALMAAAPEARQPRLSSSTATGCSRAHAPRTRTRSIHSPTSRRVRLEVTDIDGHDYRRAPEAIGAAGDRCPVGVIANTIKGKGVSFMEDRVEWHHKVPNEQQMAGAIEELRWRVD